MLLDRELKDIREAKISLTICGDLRRRLINIELQGIRLRDAPHSFEFDHRPASGRPDPQFSTGAYCPSPLKNCPLFANHGP
ncbi:MAG: hypothetical protein EHM86_01430 [Desulfobulbaceae bacterium]|nr:MAG: hypothetical protein EHM86_01430 [Desulfobulbaceae bacterium]